ncbi:MAG: hypothetical protein L3J15_01440 [Devosiaceae bacterium]|nr:hypothetical protein [Devosiaceae bacterium]
MKLADVLSKLEMQNLIAKEKIVEIGDIDNDIVDASLFTNILLSLGAFITVIFSVASIIAFMAMTMMFDIDFDNIWIYLSILSAILIGLSYLGFSATSLYRLRLSSFFSIIGKITFIILILERIFYFTGYDFSYNIIAWFMVVALIVAVANIYFSKFKFDIVALLFLCFLAIQNTYSIISGIGGIGVVGEYQQMPWIIFYLLKIIIWVGPIVLLLKYNRNFNAHLPFYAFILVQVFAIELFYLGNEITINEATNNLFNLQIGQIFYNLILLAPSVFLAIKLLKQHKQKITWQYYFTFALLLIGTILPISGLYIIIFCFLYGNIYRNGFILIISYILMPLFVATLYLSLQISLDTASALAAIIGIGLLALYAMVRFSKFAKMEG